MIEAYRSIREIQAKHNDEIDLRRAAFVFALDKVAKFLLHAGHLPVI